MHGCGPGWCCTSMQSRSRAARAEQHTTEHFPLFWAAETAAFCSQDSSGYVSIVGNSVCARWYCSQNGTSMSAQCPLPSLPSAESCVGGCLQVAAHFAHDET